MVSFPYHSHIFRDSGLGVVWEACMGPMSCVGVPENPTDVDFFSDVIGRHLIEPILSCFFLKSVGCNPTNKQTNKQVNGGPLEVVSKTDGSNWLQKFLVVATHSRQEWKPYHLDFFTVSWWKKMVQHFENGELVRWNMSSWWLQPTPLLKYAQVKLDHFPNFRAENRKEKYSKFHQPRKHSSKKCEYLATQYPTSSLFETSKTEASISPTHAFWHWKTHGKSRSEAKGSNFSWVTLKIPPTFQRGCSGIRHDSKEIAKKSHRKLPGVFMILFHQPPQTHPSMSVIPRMREHGQILHTEVR